METQVCTCDTKKPFSECCEPVLKGARNPESPAELMRARYSAFVHHEIDFILNTVSPAKRKEFDRQGIEDWSRNTEWKGLEIVSTVKGGPADATGEVEFIAKYREKDEDQNHHELASFVKLNGKWYFDDGRTPSQKPIKLDGPKIGRNDPCHCGSGKKFKKCHGVAESAAA
jgi:SEC-C motif domain protein